MQWVQLFGRSCSKTVKRIFHWVRLKLNVPKLATTRELKSEKTNITRSKQLPSDVAQLTSSQKNYFVRARSWVDDLYTATVISRNRYKIAFLIAMGLAILLAIAVNSLIPLQQMVPLLVNHYPDGHVSVQPIKQNYAPVNQSQVESDIVRYVINREGYDPSSYGSQYSLTHLLSDPLVSKQYDEEQSSSNLHSPIDVLGNRGFRVVHVESVVFLDSQFENKGKPQSQQSHHNLAQVNFTITDHFKTSVPHKTKALTALISWSYNGLPSNPNDRWRNWDGFTVTRYTVEQRNV